MYLMKWKYSTLFVQIHMGKSIKCCSLYACIKNVSMFMVNFNWLYLYQTLQWLPKQIHGGCHIGNHFEKWKQKFGNKKFSLTRNVVNHSCKAGKSYQGSLSPSFLLDHTFLSIACIAFHLRQKPLLTIPQLPAPLNVVKFPHQLPPASLAISFLKENL